MTDAQTSLSVALPGGRAYPIHFGPLANVPALLAGAGLEPGRCLLVTDTNVAPLYAGPLATALRDAGWSVRLHTVPAGEPSKAFAPLQTLYDAALAWGIDRKTPVLALGGGVVGDLAGFAAATLLRGLPLVQLPTTLIAQVDSAIGGKTGINHAVGKNLIGAFYQPVFVCADVATLASLPVREWTSGLAEAVKHALIADLDLFDVMERRFDDLVRRDAGTVQALIPRAAAIKAEIVAEDERERGRRALLNFGHTFGHAIEKVAGYGTFTHGEAVILGMRAALHLSKHKTPALDADRAEALLRSIPVPGGVEELPTEALMDAMRADKKVEAGQLRVILLDAIGSAYVTADVTPQEVARAWTYLKQNA